MNEIPEIREEFDDRGNLVRRTTVGFDFIKEEWDYNENNKQIAYRNNKGINLIFVD